MSKHLKPRPLRRGDKVAVVTPSWGGPSAFPDIFDRGLQVMRELLQLEPVELAATRMPAAAPKRRAADINAAFDNDDIAAIFAAIGGEDSMLLLPHLDFDLIRRKPKLIVGFSDTTTLLASIAAAGVVTMHGPAVMAGIAQAPALGIAFETHLQTLLLDGPAEYDYRPYPQISTGYPDWGDPANIGAINVPASNAGWRWVQRGTARRGRFWGGCIEVLEFLKGTDYWPAREYFDNVFLLLETSEESPSPDQVRRWLRNYGLQTILDRIQGLVFGRPAGYSSVQRDELANVLHDVVVGEFGRTDLPIVMNVDVGHTDPQWLVPFGIEATIDASAQRIALLESVFA